MRGTVSKATARGAKGAKSNQFRFRMELTKSNRIMPNNGKEFLTIANTLMVANFLLASLEGGRMFCSMNAFSLLYVDD